MWVVQGLVKSEVHVPGENEQPSTWHTHMSAPPPGDPMLGSSPSRIQGYPQDGWHRRMNDTGGQASVSEAHNFIFKRSFYTLTCT